MDDRPTVLSIGDCPAIDIIRDTDGDGTADVDDNSTTIWNWYQEGVGAAGRLLMGPEVQAWKGARARRA